MCLRCANISFTSTQWTIEGNVGHRGQLCYVYFCASMPLTKQNLGVLCMCKESENQVHACMRACLCVRGMDVSKKVNIKRAHVSFVNIHWCTFTYMQSMFASSNTRAAHIHKHTCAHRILACLGRCPLGAVPMPRRAAQPSSLPTPPLQKDVWWGEITTMAHWHHIAISKQQLMQHKWSHSYLYVTPFKSTTSHDNTQIQSAIPN